MNCMYASESTECGTTTGPEDYAAYCGYNTAGSSAFSIRSAAFSIDNVIDHSKRSSYLVCSALQTKTSWFWTRRRSVFRSNGVCLLKCSTAPIALTGPLGRSFSFLQSLSSGLSNRDSNLLRLATIALKTNISLNYTLQRPTFSVAFRS